MINNKAVRHHITAPLSSGRTLSPEVMMEWLDTSRTPVHLCISWYLREDEAMRRRMKLLSLAEARF
jgi:hypothetical protein